MMLVEMLPYLRKRLECDGRLAPDHCEGRRRARLLFPLLNFRGIADDLDLAAELFERHAPRVTLIVQCPESCLVGAMIGWPQQRAVQPAARHVREIALGRLALLGLL